jgi:hypothetical protein
MKFKDNNEILEFINKAQSKIGELGLYIANRKHDKSSSELCKELIYVIKAFLNPYNSWSEEQALSIVNYYNVKAELNNIPYLKIEGYSIKSIIQTTSRPGNIMVADISDYTPKTNDLIRKTPHNLLSSLQGGSPSQYYHIDKKMYDWLISQVYPFIQPTVSMQVVPSTLIYEKGVGVSGINFIGAHVLNSGKSVIKTKWYKDSVMVQETISADSTSYMQTASINTTTTYKYEVDFEEGGTKSTTSKIDFILPYYYTLGSLSGTPGDTTALLLRTNFTRVLAPKPVPQMDILFNIPSGNATSTSPVSPRVYIPISYGHPAKILADNNPMFDYKNDWTFFTKTITLDDATTTQYYVYKFTQAAEGTFNFNFIWQ